jgi:hypothetical protein
MVHSKHLLSNFKDKLGKVKIGDGAEVKALGSVTLNGYHMNKDGKHIDVSLNDVL